MRNVINPGIWLITLAFLLAIGFSTTAAAKTIYVDDDGPADFNNIQAAINDANDGDTIIAADGIYTGTGNRDIDFKGKAITVRSENGPADCNLLDADNWTSSNRLGRNNRWLDGQFRLKLPLSIFIRKE
jgi:hypothetical protein